MHTIYFKCFFCLLLITSIPAAAQPSVYTAAQAHAHNDYVQALPFWNAYNHKVGSIEADVFSHNGQLLVAHEAKELSPRKSLESIYLRPMDSMLVQHHGYIYADTTQQLQLMIDIKSDGLSTLHQIVQLLQKYPAIVRSKTVRIAISGNRPLPEHFQQYPTYIYFDGLPGVKYKTAELEKIIMISDNFRNHSAWNGEGEMPNDERLRLQQLIERAHAAGKKVRLWNAPDNAVSWCVLMSLGVDYINTDHVADISSFLTRDFPCN